MADSRTMAKRLANVRRHDRIFSSSLIPFGGSLIWVSRGLIGYFGGC
jgi:hypothetical protein